MSAQKPVVQDVVMPPNTLACKSNKKVTTTVDKTPPQPQYENVEFVYYNNGGESKTFESLQTEIHDSFKI